MARLKSGDFAITLSLVSSGLANADVPRPGQSRILRALILFNGALYEKAVQLTYLAKRDKTGKAKALERFPQVAGWWMIGNPLNESMVPPLAREWDSLAPAVNKVSTFGGLPTRILAPGSRGIPDPNSEKS